MDLEFGVLSKYSLSALWVLSKYSLCALWANYGALSESEPKRWRLWSLDKLEPNSKHTGFYRPYPLPFSHFSRYFQTSFVNDQKTDHVWFHEQW